MIPAQPQKRGPSAPGQAGVRYAPSPEPEAWVSAQIAELTCECVQAMTDLTMRSSATSGAAALRLSAATNGFVELTTAATALEGLLLELADRSPVSPDEQAAVVSALDDIMRAHGVPRAQPWGGFGPRPGDATPEHYRTQDQEMSDSIVQVCVAVVSFASPQSLALQEAARLRGIALAHHDSAAELLATLDDTSPAAIVLRDPELGAEPDPQTEELLSWARSHNIPVTLVLPDAYLRMTDTSTQVKITAAGITRIASDVDDAAVWTGMFDDLLSLRENRPDRVLVVDDDPDFTAAVAAILSQQGIVVVEVIEPTDLLRAASEFGPDLILLDMEMPELDGVEICRAIRGSRDLHELPILFLTVHTDVATRVRAFDVGADDYISKPVVAGELVSRVKVRLERSRLIAARSGRDPLTGLFNRRSFLDSASRLLALAIRQGTPLSVVMFDVDHFKDFNDRFGHQLGDRELASLASFLRLSLRTTDVVARWGGEEFVACMPGSSAPDVKAKLERLLAGYAARDHADSEIGEIHSTFTVGVASYPNDGTILSRLIQVSDARMYIGKHAGRARVIVADDQVIDGAPTP